MTDIHQATLAEKRYKETCEQLFSAFEQNPRLTLKRFWTSLTQSVDISGFRNWMDSHGYGRTIDEWHRYYLKLQENQNGIQNNTQLVENRESNKDIMNTNNSNAQDLESPQYWWLNVDPETWDIEHADIEDDKTISFFDNKKKGKEVFDGNFIKWLYCYFIDKEDNPHFSYPIHVFDPVYSYLNFIGQDMSNTKLISKGKQRMTEAINSFLGNMGIITKTSGKKKHIKCWIPDKNGKDKTNRRVLGYRTYEYFYRNRPNEIPKKTDEMLDAPKLDPELSYSNIKTIQPFMLAKVGDLVFACSTTSKKIYAILQIRAINDKGQIEFWIENKFDEPCSITALDTPYCDYCPGSNLGLFRLTRQIGNDIIKKIEKETGVSLSESEKNYSMEKLLKDVFVSEEVIKSMSNALNFKKNIIIQGAPGVGKTYLAKKLAFARMGKKYNNRVCYVQFHPNYTYEDFIIGYKPNDKGSFKAKEGVFMKLCKKALGNSKNDYYLIIDEINRGNLSKIFGEAFTLIEKDHRGEPISLAISDKQIIVPKNVYIIGLMNTADRNLAMIDIALRRRFAFFTLEPAFNNNKFKDAQKELGNEPFNEVIKQIVEINNVISDDPALGPGFCIGHSFFCNKKGLDATQLEEVVECEIIPLLKQYWFDDKEKAEELSERLRTALKSNLHDKQ